METTLFNIAEIKPYWRNPRDNEKAIDAVMQSIKDYGFNQPLIIDSENVIIAGHTRYKALLRLGATSIPCIVKSDLTPQQAKEYRIADNKTSELSSWDMDRLIPELREIESIVDMSIYFPTIDLSELLQQTAGAIGFQNPTEITIGKVEQRLQGAMTERNKEIQSAYVEVRCPHCGDSFHVDRNEIANSRNDA